jgi:hypothetical protein
MNAEIQKRIDNARKKAEAAAIDWLKEKEGDIGHTIRMRLDSRMDSIVAKLLGFDDHWGKWEVDHCNGRNGESAAGDWLRQQVGETIKSWLAEQAGNLPKLPKTAITGLRKEYLRVLESELSKLMRDAAVRDARELVDQGDLLQTKSPW